MVSRRPLLFVLLLGLAVSLSPHFPARAQTAQDARDFRLGYNAYVRG